MQSPSLVCGNCGKSIALDDVTCAHCGVLLAAYASPMGATTAHMYESSEPIADAVPKVEMTTPKPAPPVEIPDEVDIASTAPRPLFDTQLTVEEISRAAEGDHEESLVVVNERKVVSKPKAFNVPDYARPPANAEPVGMVDGIDEDMIARTHEEAEPTPAQVSKPKSKPEPPRQPEPAPQPARNVEKREEPTPRAIEDSAARDDAKSAEPTSEKVVNRPSYSVPPSRIMPQVDDVEPATQEAVPAEQGVDESWLYDLSKSGPAARAATPKRERKDRPQPTRTTTQAPSRRGSTESYLKKLHAESGYNSAGDQLSAPVDTRSSKMPSRPGMTASNQGANLAQSRKGCSYLLYFILIIMWFSVLTGVITGHVNFGLLAMTVALTFVARFLRKPLPGEKPR